MNILLSGFPLLNGLLLFGEEWGNGLELLGVIIGLIYLWLEYKANIYLWIAGIIMPVIYIFVFYNAGLYADTGINVYYLLAAIYGWVSWRFHKKKYAGGESPITHTPKNIILHLTTIFIIIFLGIAWILINFTDSNVPWLDSFTTALSVIAMWMLAKKYLEQWLVWIIVDLTSSGLYIYKELNFTAILYVIYTIIAIFGYIKWKNMIRLKNIQNKPIPCPKI